MDGGSTRVQGFSNLCSGPAATVGTDIGFEPHLRMESLRCRGPPGVHEPKLLGVFLRVKSDNILEHRRSPRWGNHHEGNRSLSTCQVSTVEALAWLYPQPGCEWGEAALLTGVTRVPWATGHRPATRSASRADVRECTRPLSLTAGQGRACQNKSGCRVPRRADACFQRLLHVPAPAVAGVPGAKSFEASCRPVEDAAWIMLEAKDEMTCQGDTRELRETQWSCDG
jgi:hypothetical protein